MTDIKTQIAAELVKAVRTLGAKSDLTGIIASYGDTMSDDWVLEALRRWNREHASRDPDA